MAELPIVVVGAGFAGVAAAWAVAEAGARALVISARAGSSELYSGMLDGPSPARDVRALAHALGLLTSAEPRAIATREGMVRRVHGRDAALLDLEAVAGHTVAVADIARDEWDAELLARSYAASEWARGTNTSFRAVKIEALNTGAERRISAFDFARLFDAPARAVALGQALAAATGGAAAWLLGPWLGVETNACEAVSSAAGQPVGETASALGGAAGARFAARRAALFASRRIESQTRVVRAIEATASGPLVVLLEDGERVLASSVVVAVGGVAGGGIALGPARLTLSLALPARLELDGDVLDGASWLSGPSFQRQGLRALESLGVAVDHQLAIAPNSRVFACGDALAAQPRNAFAALSSGIAAGRSALARAAG